MAIIDRYHAAPSADDLERLHELDAAATAAPAPAPTTTDPAWSMPGRVLLAALSAAAGVIHLVMVPAHAAEWLAEGLAFAAAGWLQIGLAVVLVARPSRLALRITCLANIVFIAAWLVSRVWGLPIGPEAGVAHAATFVDVVCVCLEAVLVVVGYELLAKPSLGARLSSGAQVMLSIVPVGILVLATAAIASPSALNHAHGGSGGEAAAHDHAAGADGATTAASDGHDHGAVAAEDDKGLSLIMNGAGEGGGHVHSNEVVPVDATTQAQLDAQLAQLKPFIEKYPTVKDAEAGGYHRNGPYSPALGAHYAASGKPTVGFGPTVTDESLKGGMLIYDGVEPDSKLAGFMFMIYSTDTQNPPEGFAGPNDHWHFHTNVCIVPRADGGVDSPLGADTAATKELCDTFPGGILIANTGYMVHVWPVPGYESDQGLFSNLNSKLKCADGTYYTIPLDQIGSRTTVCRDAAG